MHTAVNYHSGLAYAEILTEEKGATCAGFLPRPAAVSRQPHGITVREVITDNAEN